MQDLHLFKNLVGNSGENAFTEALAATLKASPSFQEDFLAYVGCTDRSCKVKTQPVYSEGRPDILISSDKTFLLIEVKWNEPLMFEQWENYQCVLDKQNASFKLLAAITTPSTKIDEKILSQPRVKVFTWPVIYQIAECSLAREKHPIAKFIVSELIDLLEAHNMKPFSGFSGNDVDTLNGLYATNTKMGVFFGDVLAKLKEDLGSKQKGNISVETFGYKIEAWKGYHDIYVGNGFSMHQNNLNLWGWVGCYFSLNGPKFLLYSGPVGTGLKREVLEKAFKGNGFQYDDEEVGYVSYFRYLSSNLTVNSKGRNLVKQLAEEIEDVMIKIFSKLQRVK